MIIFYLLIHVKHINIIPTGKFFHDIFQSTLRKTKRPMPPSHLFIHIHRPYPYFIIFQPPLLHDRLYEHLQYHSLVYEELPIRMD